ncbi:MAG: TrmB family transcriptional regulator [Euryarchaeota archaeon]|nr:TrmB family transcriptional regulator [Euryarchaeota archaeon]
MEISNGTEIEKAIKSIIEGLKILGLTDYEARAFMALILIGGGEADDVAKMGRIPRTSAYKVLESLEKKGFAKIIQGKPRIFKPSDLDMLEEKYKRRIEEIFSHLRLAKEMYGEKGEPQLVYTVYGKGNVLRKIGEIIDLSESEIYLSSPKLGEIRRALSEQIKKALSRNVKIIVITSRTQRAPKNTEVHYKEGLIATDIVSDGRRALIADAELAACGYSDNPALAQHLKHFIEILLYG